MIKKSYIFLTLALITVIVFGLLKYAVKPSPVQVMKISDFSGLEDMGRVMLQRLYPEINDKKFFWIGIPSRTPDIHQFIAGFVAEAEVQKIPFEEIWLQEGMAELVRPTGPVQEKNFNIENVQTIEEALDKTPKRVLIITPNLYSTYKMPASPVQRFNQKPLTLTVGILAYRHDLEREMDPPCTGGMSDKMNTSGLGCEFFSRSLNFRGRKKMHDDRWQAIADRWSEFEFLLLFSRPR